MASLYFDENIPINITRGLQKLTLSHTMTKNLNLSIKATIDDFGESAQDDEILQDIGKNKNILVTNDIKMKREFFQIIDKYNVSVIFICFAKESPYWDRAITIIRCWETLLTLINFDKRFAYKIKIHNKQIKWEQL